MIETLFRGIRIDNGEWVYGSPVYIDGYVEMYWFDSEKQEIEHTLVAPETVGQYTGMKDKNRKEIFEGDVVRCVILYDVGQYPHYESEVREVVYQYGYFTPFIKCSEHECEIVGNIHDNPELLEVK